MGQPSAGPRKRGRPAATAPPPEPRGHRRQLPSPQLFGCEVLRRGPAAAECLRAARAGTRVRLGRGRSAAACLEVGEALLGWSIRTPKRSRPHSAIGCSGVFCKSWDALHSLQVCGVSAKREWNSSISRDLPRPGSPTIRTSWPSPARARSQRRVSRSQFLLAADERR